MLRRVADSVYWLSRYIERAENVARFVDVNQSISLGGHTQWAPLIHASGDSDIYSSIYGEYTPANVLKFLLFDKQNPNCILGCLVNARENARAIREILSGPMWEAINRFYLRVREASMIPDAILANPADFLSWVKQSSHEFIGVTEATISHDDAWNFTRLGRMIERADKTSRILDVKYFVLLPELSAVGSTLDIVQWSALLESSSALHMYRKRFGRISAKSVADFLILDADFPRSIRFCVTQAEVALHEITGRPIDHCEEDIEREFAKLRTQLENTTIDAVFHLGLHEFIDQIQFSLNEIGAAIFRRFLEIRPDVSVQAQQ